MMIRRKGFGIIDFALGLRFLTGDGFTPADAWDLLFETLPADLMCGAELNGLYETTSEGPCYMCILNALPLKRFRLLWPAIASRPVIASHLLFYRPVYQSNRLEHLEGDYELLGTVTESGTVENGTVSHGKMRFFGPVIEKKMPEAPIILIAPDSYLGILSPTRCARILMRTAEEFFPHVQTVPFRLTGGGPGTADALVCALGGRFVKAGPDGEDSTKEMTYAVLPDRSIAFESDSRAEADSIIRETLDLGFRSYVIGLYGDAVPKNDTFLTALPYPGAEIATVRLLEKGMSPKELLELMAFDGKAKAAACVITGDGRKEEEHGAMTREVLVRCKTARVPAFALDGADRCPETEEQAEEMLRAAAARLFASLKAGRRFRRK